MQHRLIIGILLIGILQAILLVVMIQTPTPANHAGMAHDIFAGMAVGGDSAARYFPISNWAFLFQLLVLGQAHLFIALGVQPKRRTPVFMISLMVCYLLAVFVWWQMINHYERFLMEGSTTFTFGFPTATAWQVYGVWLAGLSLVILYTLGFKHYVWSDEDEARFKALTSKQ